MKNILFIFLVIISLPSFASTITVGKGKQFNSIKPALHAAKDGDLIEIYEGEYAEGEIVIDKKLHLKGINWPLINGKFKGQVVTILASGVVFEGIKVYNGGRSSMFDFAGIKVKDAWDVILKNNQLLNNNFGIYLENARKCTVSGNYIKSNSAKESESGNAIHCWKSSHINILNNTVTGHRDGIYFEFVTDSHIEKNKSIKNVRYGLHFMFSHNNAYINNIFKLNGSGVAVMYTKNVTMKGNHFEENWGNASYGLLLKEISDSKIENNKFVKNTIGILMEGTSRVHVANNELISNGWAMRVQSSSVDNVITNNNFIGNSFDVATNGSLQLNDFNANYWDKYEGYDLNKDNVGDVPYRPVSMFSMIAEKNEAALMLYRSFLVDLLDKTEKVIPAIIPSDLIDEKPLMKRIRL